MADSGQGKNSKLRGLGAVGLRFDFYREGFTASLTVSVILAIAVIAQMFLISHLANRPVERQYFTVDNMGRLVQQKALNAPYMTESALLQFASRAVTDAYTFDAENYRKVFNDLSQYFTPEGNPAFIASMQPQIKYVLDKTLISSAVAGGTPVLVDQGVSPNGVWAYKIKVPVIVTFRTQTESSTVRRLVTLIVVNRPTFETPYGVGISSFLATDK